MSIPKWFYGRQAAFELLKSGKPVRRILIAENSQEKFVAGMVALAREKSVPIEKVPKLQIDSMTQTHHQGIAVQTIEAGAIDFKSFLDELQNDPKTFVALLDEIQDPHNLGAILRSAACFGCSGVVIPKWRSAPVTDTVMKASSGAAAHLPVVQIANLSVAIERLQEKGFTVYGADADGEPLTTVEIQSPLALILGNEHRGIKPLLKKSCDKLVSIPQTRTIASLNVSNAATIFFYEISKSLNQKS